MAAIGIDLGTTNCCMAYVDDSNRPVIIPNHRGDHVTPCYLSFVGNDILFGKTAMNRRVQNETNTIYDVKRFIGRNFNDPCVKKFSNRWKFNLVNDKQQIKVHIQNKDIDKMYTPEMLSGLLLKDLKRQAEKFIGKSVTKAYITVPTYFNDAQRQSTIDAGRIAGFQDVKLLNEPTAAAIAYSIENCSNMERTIFIFDFGGGTFDVSVIKFKNRNIQVVSIDGDIELGGNDVTNSLVEYYDNKFKMDYKFDVHKDARKYYRLEQICEHAKIELSEAAEANLQFLEFIPEDCEFVIERHEFDKMNNHIFERTLEIVDRCLKRSALDINSIDDIVVVGGSTRIKNVVTLLHNYFKKPLKFTINADEAVAMGAAIAAAKWEGNHSFSDVAFQDICPYSLGVEKRDVGEMSIIIDKFEKIPARVTKGYQTRYDNQVTITFNIYSGENPLVKYNEKLGKLSISGYKPGPAGTIKVDTTFTYDENGILSVELEERSSNIKRNLEIQLDKGSLTPIALEETSRVIEQEYEEHENRNEFQDLRNKIISKLPEINCSLRLNDMITMTYSKEDLEYLRQKFGSML